MTDKQYMAMALAQARQAYAEKEIPIGAVLVNGSGDLICADHNRIEQLGDATAHAELLILRGKNRLNDCTLYSTVEPCAMCAGALVLCRVKRLVYGAPDSRFGAAESLFNITKNPALNWQVEVTAGVMELESLELMKKFFTEMRLNRIGDF